MSARVGVVGSGSNQPVATMISTDPHSSPDAPSRGSGGRAREPVPAGRSPAGEGEGPR